MEFGKRLIGATVCWTAAAALASAATAGVQRITPWMLLLCSTALVLSVWAIVEHVVSKATMDAATYACDRIERCNDEAIEQVARQIAEALHPQAERAPVKRVH